MEKQRVEFNIKKLLIICGLFMAGCITLMLVTPYQAEYLSQHQNFFKNAAVSLLMLGLTICTFKMIKSISQLDLSNRNIMIASAISAIFVFVIMTLTNRFTDAFNDDFKTVLIFSVIFPIMSLIFITFGIGMVRGENKPDVGKKALFLLLVPIFYAVLIVGSSLFIALTGPERLRSGDVLSDEMVAAIKDGKNISSFIDEMSISDDEKSLMLWIMNNDIESMKPSDAKLAITSDASAFETPYGTLYCAKHRYKEDRWTFAEFVPHDTDDKIRMKRFTREVVEAACERNTEVASKLTEWKFNF